MDLCYTYFQDFSRGFSGVPFEIFAKKIAYISYRVLPAISYKVFFFFKLSLEVVSRIYNSKIIFFYDLSWNSPRFLSRILTGNYLKNFGVAFGISAIVTPRALAGVFPERFFHNTSWCNPRKPSWGILGELSEGPKYWRNLKRNFGKHSEKNLRHLGIKSAINLGKNIREIQGKTLKTSKKFRKEIQGKFRKTAKELLNKKLLVISEETRIKRETLEACQINISKKSLGVLPVKNFCINPWRGIGANLRNKSLKSRKQHRKTLGKNSGSKSKKHKL